MLFRYGLIIVMKKGSESTGSVEDTIVFSLLPILMTFVVIKW